MYEQYYGLQARPFQLTPDPQFYFESLTHRKALSYLGYGLAQGEGFIVITGDVGAGKTTLVGHLMSTIDPMRLTAVQIVSTQVEGEDMLRLAAQSFGIATEKVRKAQLLQAIERFLHDQARRGLRTLLIVDEAQNLSVTALEELRMLSNFQLGGQALLQIFLLGQPEFRTALASPSLEQLRQRVIATHHLEPMQASEVEPYVHHRLRLVGWSGNPRLTTGAFAAIYTATRGVPRRINALMNRVLLMGAVEQSNVIDGRMVETVAMEMGGDMLAGSTVSAQADDAPVEAPESVADAVVEQAPAMVSEVSVEQPVVDLAAVPDVAPEPDMAPVAPPADEPEVAAPAATQPAARDPRIDALMVEMATLRAEGVAARSEVTQLAAQTRVQAGASATREDELLSRIRQLEERMHKAEARGEEQEVALRRVLAMLVEWVEGERQTLRAS